MPLEELREEEPAERYVVLPEEDPLRTAEEERLAEEVLFTDEARPAVLALRLTELVLLTERAPVVEEARVAEALERA